MSVKEAILGGSTEVFLSRRGVILAHLPPPGEGKLAILGSFWLHMSADWGSFLAPLDPPEVCNQGGTLGCASEGLFSRANLYAPGGPLDTVRQAFWPILAILPHFRNFLPSFGDFFEGNPA